MMTAAFAGFPKEMFSFLSDLSAHNDREWFQANKPRYEAHVVAPVLRFIEAVGIHVLPDISDAFLAEPKRSGGSMFRIYRDTRFARDKRPYKENVGCHFRHVTAKDAHAPAFYVHLAPDEVFFGAGSWKPDSAALGKIRTAIAEQPKRWASVKAGSVWNGYFDGLEGDRLQRPPKGFDKDHPHIDDLKMKGFFLLRQVNPERALKKGFVDEVGEAFGKAGPLVRFITEALELAY